MVCKNCGAEIEQGDKFCLICGASVDEGGAAEGENGKSTFFMLLAVVAGVFSALMYVISALTAGGGFRMLLGLIMTVAALIGALLSFMRLKALKNQDTNEGGN